MTEASGSEMQTDSRPWAAASSPGICRVKMPVFMNADIFGANITNNSVIFQHSAVVLLFFVPGVRCLLRGVLVYRCL